MFNLADKRQINKDVTENFLSSEISSSVTTLCNIESSSYWNVTCEMTFCYPL
jgi:hypothetical protein